MSVYFISDLHLGHRGIVAHTERTEGSWRGGGTTVEEHDEWVMDQLHSVPATKRTLWWIMGDVAMDPNKLRLLAQLPGTQRLIFGNHDKFQTSRYTRYFSGVHGGFKKYGLWVTHIPVHPAELRGHPNIHGHCHHDTLRDDPRYLNVAIEWAPGRKPMELEEVRAHFENLGIAL